MIKSIHSNSKYISISGGGAPVSTYISPGSMGAGMLRWNSNMNQMEVNDGNSWIPLAMNYATIELTPEVEGLLEWAKRKQREEQEMTKLSQTHPAMKKAIDAVNLAQEQANLIYKLSIEHNDFGEVQASP